MRSLALSIVFLAIPACNGPINAPETVNENPIARIVDPDDGVIINENEVFQLRAFVWDFEDGHEELAVRWESDVDGEINTGSVNEDDFTSVAVGLLSIGTHQIKLSAQDSTTGYAEDEITLIINGPPTEPVVSLSPSEPRTSDDIVVEFDVPSDDPEGEEVTYTYKWFVDDAPYDYVTGDKVAASRTLPYQEWRVEVTPFDGRVKGEVGTASVQVVNSLPTAPEIDISPDEYSSDMVALVCSVLSASLDDDGDTVTYSAAWELDGQPFTDTTEDRYPGDTVDVSYVQVGQEWTCIMTPNDGFEDGEPAIETQIITYPNLALDGTDETLSSGEYFYNNVSLVNGATLYVGGEVTIQAASFDVESGSTVDGTGRGGSAGYGSVGGGNGGGGRGSSAGAGGGGHGSDGGRGGYDGGDTPGSGGIEYGDPSSYENFMGSGGGGTSSNSGFGGAGGSGLMVVAETIQVDGVIDLSGADGSTGSTYGGGGGSGGGLLLHGDTVTINGSLDTDGVLQSAIYASGGAGGQGNDSGGGGSGGRIKIFASSLTGSCSAVVCWEVAGGDPGIGSYETYPSLSGGAGSVHSEQATWP